MKRTTAGILLAPLLPSIFFLDTAGFPLSFFMSYILAWAFGIPTVFALKRAEKESHIIYSVIGFLCGVAYILLMSIFSISYEAFMAALFFGVVGLFTGLTFSLIQGNTNIEPSKQTKPNQP